MEIPELSYILLTFHIHEMIVNIHALPSLLLVVLYQKHNLMTSRLAPLTCFRQLFEKQHFRNIWVAMVRWLDAIASINDDRQYC